jgi:hypothetical protein
LWSARPRSRASSEVSASACWGLDELALFGLAIFELEREPVTAERSGGARDGLERPCDCMYIPPVAQVSSTREPRNRSRVVVHRCGFAPASRY